MSGHGKWLENFLFPKLTRWFFLRVLAVAAIAYVFFGHVCLPMKIRGKSMEPTFADRGFTFCWTPSYWFTEPKRGDVVGIRYVGNGIALLKRVVGLPGDLIEFKSGDLYRNGERIEEPYKAVPSDWNLTPRTVSPGHVYVVGDNRAVPLEKHMLGEVSANRILGKVL